MKSVVEASRKEALHQEEAGIAPLEGDSDESSPEDTPEEEHNEGVPEYTPQETHGAGEEVGESYNVPRDAEPVRKPLGAMAPEVSVPPKSVPVPSPAGGDAELRHPDPDFEDLAADLNTRGRQPGTKNKSDEIVAKRCSRDYERKKSSSGVVVNGRRATTASGPVRIEESGGYISDLPTKSLESKLLCSAFFVCCAAFMVKEL
ncbi:hypothetical protein LWI29_006132 [Acer saccharum]|uniref:Uncharacterized protein n=1 Tax=Acer saccharum TaxID=4024 RepID=A0AA39RBW8_ACESA|nr:hypothetical protein LWI29_006132 [Acer saccharum]